jgi:hypothetical protein
MLRQLASFVRTHPLSAQNEVRYSQADADASGLIAAEPDQANYAQPKSLSSRETKK